MGVSCSCPFAVNLDLEDALESMIVKFDNLGNESPKTLVRCISFKNKDSTRFSEQGSIRSTEIASEDECLSQDVISSVDKVVLRSPGFDRSSPKHEAAIKLQKVYKSFRTRRKLADCAVLIEQSWWKLLDFAELKHSSISFFETDKHESAISRWARARTRAAKVGKGLSKNCKARKLALQHWLEAIDPRHRYGHNLHFYYVKWLNSPQSKEPFFYWLDVGDGKEVNLTEKCSRSKLLQQCIKYLGPMERKAYEVVIEDGKLLYKQTRELLDTINEPKDSKWIFVLSTSKTLYVAKKKKGSFQHSSFLAGGATLAAGRIVAEAGVLKAVWPHSGHYKPTPENFQDFKSFLIENMVDLSCVKLDSIDDEEQKFNVKEEARFMRNNSSEDDLTEKDVLDAEESSSAQTNSGDEETPAEIEVPYSRLSRDFCRQLSTLEKPSNDDLLEILNRGNELEESRNSVDGYGTEQESLSSETYNVERNNLSEENDETKEEIIGCESIFERINSRKETSSYQLGQQLSCKWSTGAGPRIGCLRDYPSELQSHALEHANLSPRSKLRVKFDSQSRPSTPNSSNLSRVAVPSF